jgi:hypothetical protein
MMPEYITNDGDENILQENDSEDTENDDIEECAEEDD